MNTKKPTLQLVMVICFISRKVEGETLSKAFVMRHDRFPALNDVSQITCRSWISKDQRFNFLVSELFFQNQAAQINQFICDT